jgi:DNA-3-methyladenine glycosylase
LKTESINKILKKSALEAAPLLLGCEIVKSTPDGVLRLKIVETEAYHQDDPASHTYRGLTKRTAPMFELSGHLYVYFTYGMHHALNIVTGQKGIGEAVLIRAAEPLQGIDIMLRNRNTNNIHNLANGPGKLAQALGIKDTILSGQKLSKKSLQIVLPKTAIAPDEIATSPRVGIRQAVDVPWRFYIAQSKFVSKYQKTPKIYKRATIK